MFNRLIESIRLKLGNPPEVGEQPAILQLEKAIQKTQRQISDIENRLQNGEEHSREIGVQLDYLRDRLEEGKREKRKLTAIARASKFTMLVNEKMAARVDYSAPVEAIVKLGFLFVLFVTNISLLYLLCDFARVPEKVSYFVAPTSFCFLMWIWSRDKYGLLHLAENMWLEMSDDFHKWLSKRKD